MKSRFLILLAAALMFITAGAYILTKVYPGSSIVQASMEMSGSLQADISVQVEAAAQDASVQSDTPEQADASAKGTSVQPESSSTPAQPENIGASAVDQTTGKQALRLIAVGDVMLGRGVGMKLKKYGSYEKAFDSVSALLRQGDVVFANLESPLTSSTHSLDNKRKIVLKGAPEAVSALTSAGINLVSIANNHMLDYYETGLFDTMSVLSKNNIQFSGGGKNIAEARTPAIIEKNGLKIGFLAYSDMAELVFAGTPYLKFAADKEKSGVAPLRYEMIREDVQKLRSKVDLLAVSLHWGVEDTFNATPEQRELAHKLIDDGADVILGHHPHQYQGIEIYKGKPVLYSMGNFLFDQNEPENMESFIVDMKYVGTQLKDITATPVRILDKSYVSVQTGENAEGMLSRQAGLCRDLGTSFKIENDRLIINKED